MTLFNLWLDSSHYFPACLWLLTLGAFYWIICTHIIRHASVVWAPARKVVYWVYSSNVHERIMFHVPPVGSSFIFGFGCRITVEEDVFIFWCLIYAPHILAYKHCLSSFFWSASSLILIFIATHEPVEQVVDTWFDSLNDASARALALIV